MMEKKFKVGDIVSYSHYHVGKGTGVIRVIEGEHYLVESNSINGHDGEGILDSSNGWYFSADHLKPLYEGQLKVGDLVEYTSAKVGEGVGVIRYFNGKHFLVQSDSIDGHSGGTILEEDNGWWFDTNELKLVSNEINVGSMVRTSHTPQDSKGKAVGLVTAINEHGSYLVESEDIKGHDGGGTSEFDNCWWYNADDLEVLDDLPNVGDVIARKSDPTEQYTVTKVIDTSHLQLDEVLALSLLGYYDNFEIIKRDDDSVFDLVNDWGIEKGLHEVPAEKQFLKVIEEVGEIASSMARGENTIDDIGDAGVTLSMLAMINGFTLEDAMNHAYNEIKDRTGKMVDGVFVKDEE